MQIVELKVNVEKSQLSALEAQVKALNSRTINIRVNTTGLTVLDNQTLKTLNTLTKYANAQARVETAQAKTAQATMNLAKAQTQYRTQAERSRTAAINLLTQQEKTRTAQAKITAAAEKGTVAMSKASKEVGTFQRLMGGTFTQVAARMAAWQVMGALIAVPIRAIKEAVTTLKEVDTEMVNIQKVTNATASEMERFRDQAYSLASEYGRSVQEVTQSMTAFARAGYGQNLSQMAELSTLIQNVGYVSGETADKMLLAVDAAWHLNGSQEELMAVLDGVDKITNRNATDFGKMAEGMTVAASVFAESGESIQTFAALVGTGTSATQRSGSEIARGLRTIMMNIRQIKGETEDGELIDGESIAKASAALKEFAGISTMENGELRKASDVLSDLAEKWENLDSVQQSAISEALAGKRQANVLMALMGNWDMYEKQMEEYATAAGTALKENEIYMDSWAAKSEVLKANWNEFIAHLVSVDAIKGALDGVTGVIEILDSDLGRAAITAGMFALAMMSVSKAVLAIGSSAAFRGLFSFISLLSTEGLAAFGALSASISPLMAIAALAGDFIFMAKAIDEAYVSMEEQKDVIAGLKTEYEQLTGAGSEYAQLMEKMDSGEGLTSREKARLEILKSQTAELERQIEIEQGKSFQMFQRQEAGTYQLEKGQWVDTGVGSRKDEERLKNMNKLYEEGFKKVQEGEASLEDYREVLQKILSDNAEWYDQMVEWEDLGFGDQFTEAEKKAKALYDMISMLLGLGKDEDIPIVKGLEEFEQRGAGIAEFGNNLAVNAEEIRSYFESIGLSVEDANQAIDSLREDGVIVIDIQADGVEGTLENLEALGVAVKDSDGWKVDVDGLEQLASEIGLSKGQVDLLISTLQTVNGVSFSGATDSIALVYGSVGDLIAITGDYTGGSPYNATLTATDNASSVISNALSLLGRFVSKSITLTATYITSGKGPAGGTAGSGNAGPHKAKGDLNFKGGPVLLGDELSPDGAPRPELVIARTGEAFIAGASGPVATNIPSGSRIFTYAETMDILSGGDVAQIQTYARGSGGSGTGALSLAARYLRGQQAKLSGSGGSSGSRSGSSGRSSSRGRSGRSGRSGSSGSSGGGGGGGAAAATGVEALQNELELLQAQYDFLEASNASTEDLIAKSKEIQAKLHEINVQLEATGGEQKDIIANSTEWWKELEKQRETENKKLSLLRKEYEFLEASGADSAELNKKSKEIQAQLHNINELMRATSGDQEDIVDNSIAWYEELKKIQQVQIDLYENERDLLDSEVSLMEHQGKSVSERIAKLRQIQDNLHRAAEYMRSIKANQADINKLSIEWWEIQEKILDIQKDLVSSLEASVNAQLKADREARDAEIKIWQEKIDAAKALRDIQEDQNDLDEKNKKILEAQLALKNAMNERSVRYYNAATGQWEWAADANNVKSAQEALNAAQKDYLDAVKDRDFENQINAYQAEIDRINAQYESTESFWQSFLATFDDPLDSIESVLRDMYANGLLTNEQLELLKAAGFNIEAITREINETTKRLSKLDFGIPLTDKTEYIESLVSASGSGGSDSNGDGKISKYETSTYNTKLTGGGSSGGGSSSSGGSGGTSKSGSGGTSKSGSSSGKKKTFDSGGILSGLGGIKATSADEIVIPPDIADYMLRPSASSQFKARMAELGYIYGTNKDMPGMLAGIAGSRMSNDHYGDVYQYGNITLTEGQARSMSVYDLAQMSRSLSIYRNA